MVSRCWATAVIVCLAAGGVALARGVRAGEPERPRARIEDASPRRGLAAPEVILTRVLGKATGCAPERDIIRTCQVFAAWAVLATHDCDMGVKDVEVRARRNGLAPAAVCAPRFTERTVRLDEDFEPIGVIGRYLYAEWVDSFGAFVRFRIDDLGTGTRIFEDARREESPIRFQATASGLVLDYWRHLGAESGKCTFTARDPDCWTRILEHAGVPPVVHIPAPDCSAALASDPKAGVQIAVHVHLPGLSLGEAQYLPDAPTCDPAP